jgi:oligosaccharide repeat unit polymerase
MLFNPFTGFYTVWAIALLLYELNGVLGVFYVSLSDSASVLLVLFFVCYFLGGLAILLLKGSTVRRAECIGHRALDTIWKTCLYLLPLFCLAVLWKYRIVTAVFESPFEQMAELREAANVSEISFPLASRLLTLFGYVMILNLGILTVYRPGIKAFALVVVVMGLSFVSDSMVGGRGATFNTVLIFVCTVMLSIGSRFRTIGYKHVFLGAGVLLAGIALITVILFLRSDGTMTFLERLVLDTYVYIAGTLPALSVFVDEPWPGTLPLQWTVAGIYQLADSVVRGIGGAGFLGEEDTFRTYYAPITVLGPFNSSVAVIYFYSDLREVGVIILAALLGLLGTHAYMKAIKRGRIIDIQFGALMTAMSLFTVKGMMTNGMMFWVTLSLVWIQQAFFLSDGRRRASEKGFYPREEKCKQVPYDSQVPGLGVCQ